MNRLHRKCLVASTAVHGLLLLVLLLGAAFRDAPPELPEITVLDVIPNQILDDLLSGSPPPEPAPSLAPSPAPTLVPVPAPTPEPQPTRTVPEPKVEPKPQPPPKKPAPAPEPKPKVAEPKPAPAKPKIHVAPIKPQSAPPKQRPAETGNQVKVADELNTRFLDTANRLKRELTQRTTVVVPGPGREAFANYSDVVMSIYKRQWIKPIGIEETATVKATVTIARDGRVVSTRITRLSGNRTVDESVEQVLQRVKTVAPFPANTTDSTRTFDLSFELIPADLSG